MNRGPLIALVLLLATLLLIGGCRQTPNPNRIVIWHQMRVDERIVLDGQLKKFMAEHPGVMDPDDYDLSGFCVGMVDRPRIVDGSAPRRRAIQSRVRVCFTVSSSMDSSQHGFRRSTARSQTAGRTGALSRCVRTANDRRTLAR